MSRVLVGAVHFINLRPASTLARPRYTAQSDCNVGVQSEGGEELGMASLIPCPRTGVAPMLGYLRQLFTSGKYYFAS